MVSDPLLFWDGGRSVKSQTDHGVTVVATFYGPEAERNAKAYVEWANSVRGYRGFSYSGVQGAAAEAQASLHGVPIMSEPTLGSPEPRCGDCRYFSELFDGRKSHGICCRNPPLANGDSLANWPVVVTGDWCGQFERREGG